MDPWLEKVKIAVVVKAPTWEPVQQAGSFGGKKTFLCETSFLDLERGGNES